MTMNLLGLSFLLNSVLYGMNMVKAIEGSCESASALTNALWPEEEFWTKNMSGGIETSPYTMEL